MVDGQDNTKHILSTDDVMMSSAKPAPCTFQEFTTSINDTVVNGRSYVLGEGWRCT